MILEMSLWISVLFCLPPDIHSFNIFFFMKEHHFTLKLSCLNIKLYENLSMRTLCTKGNDSSSNPPCNTFHIQFLCVLKDSGMSIDWMISTEPYSKIWRASAAQASYSVFPHSSFLPSATISFSMLWGVFCSLPWPLLSTTPTQVQ